MKRFKKASKKLAAVFLVVILCIGFSAIPASALTTFVSTFEGLANAIEDQAVTNILVTQDIQMERPIEIDHDVVIAASSEVTLYSAETDRHFIVKGDRTTVSFSNVILNGNTTGGGIVCLANNTILNTVQITECYSESNGAAVLMQSEGTSLTIVNGNLWGNRTEKDGASVYMTSSTKLTVLSSSITNNIAKAGAGIFSEGVSEAGNAVTIFDCILSGNSSHNPDDTIEKGVALFARYTTIDISESTINGNRASSSVSAYYCEAKITNSQVYDNYTNRAYGSLYFRYNHNLPIYIGNVNFESNYAWRGGAIYAQSYTDLTIEDCTFTNNSVYHRGGALEFAPNYDVGFEKTTVKNCTFTQNSCGYYGGAVYYGLTNGKNHQANFIDCDFIQNKAIRTGGAVQLDIILAQNANTYFTNCKFDSNKATKTDSYGNGGAISILNNVIDKQNLVYTNDCLFKDNYAANDGGAIYTPAYVFLFVNENTEFHNNSAGNGGQYMYLPEDITVYMRQIKATVITSPFYYAYNNCDINYTDGVPA